MHNFKPGDLALTLIDLSPVMAGSVVELIQKIKKGDLVQLPHRRVFAKINGWICFHSGFGLRIACSEKVLMPLRGDFQPEEQKSRELVE